MAEDDVVGILPETKLPRRGASILIGQAKEKFAISWLHARAKSKFFAVFRLDDLPTHVLQDWDNTKTPLKDNPDFMATWALLNMTFPDGYPRNKYFVNYFNMDLCWHVVFERSIPHQHDRSLTDGKIEHHVFTNPTGQLDRLLVDCWADTVNHGRGVSEDLNDVLVRVVKHRKPANLEEPKPTPTFVNYYPIFVSEKGRYYFSNGV